MDVSLTSMFLSPFPSLLSLKINKWFKNIKNKTVVVRKLWLIIKVITRNYSAAFMFQEFSLIFILE